VEKYSLKILNSFSFVTKTLHRVVAPLPLTFALGIIERIA